MSETIAPPTPLARQFVRLLVGFGVGVGLGSAPFLGIVDVPLAAIRECVHDSAQLSVR
jgi:hypothetical protein